MSIETDIVTALASVASGRVYPDAAPQDAALPLVIIKRVSSEPLMTLQGYAGLTKSEFSFECWGSTKSSAVSTRDAVFTAIDAAAGLTIKTREQSGSEEYEPNTDQYAEVAQYSFWHP